MSYDYRKKTVKKDTLIDRTKDNYDVVFLTVGAIIVLGLLGFPITKQTTIIDNNNPLKR